MIKILIKKIILLSLFSISLLANTSITKVKYEGGISLFGKVAEADAVLEKNLNKNTYKMKIIASSIGLVKALTSNRKDIFISEGKIQLGVFVPYKFTRIVTKENYSKKIIYTFNYNKNKVLKETYLNEVIDDSHYDIISLQKIPKEKVINSYNKKYILLKRNDYISMYLNLSINKLNIGSIDYIDQKDTDKVILMGKTIFEVRKKNGDEIYHIKFSNPDGIFFEKAVAEDIAFYGDAYLKKIHEEKTIIN